jgi:hypothetical protein
MFARSFSKFSRLMAGLLVLAVMMLAMPGVVSAATPSIDIVSVKAGESVTFRAYDFPANTRFVIRMDVSGNRGENGLAVAELNTGAGGSFEATVAIPAALKDTRTIAIRLESANGFYAYNWFTNNTSASQPAPTQPTNPGTIPVTGAKPYLTFGEIKANESVVVEARNLPANTRFTVRVGPFTTFFRDYVTAPAVTSDANGYAKFIVTLPAVVKNVEMVTVRIDGGGRYAFNAFKNVSGGTSIPVTGAACQIVSAAPSGSVSPRADLDVVWTVKNTGTRTWDVSAVDYMYVSGTKFHKYNDRYDLPQTVKPGESVRIVLDVTAPATAGSYSANWALVDGSTTLCNLSYSLRVR